MGLREALFTVTPAMTVTRDSIIAMGRNLTCFGPIVLAGLIVIAMTMVPGLGPAAGGATGAVSFNFLQKIFTCFSALSGCAPRHRRYHQPQGCG